MSTTKPALTSKKQQAQATHSEGAAQQPTRSPPIWPVIGLALGGVVTFAWSIFLLWGTGHLVGLW